MAYKTLGMLSASQNKKQCNAFLKTAFLITRKIRLRYKSYIQ